MCNTRRRSLAAKVLAEVHDHGRVKVRSADSEPGDGLDPAVVTVLHERGLSSAGEISQLLTWGGVQTTDVAAMISMVPWTISTQPSATTAARIQLRGLMVAP